jgi:2-haloacid dehalogenase
MRSHRTLDEVKALAFDLFGTVLDLGGSLTPPLARFLDAKGARKGAAQVWSQWRYRQRIEQYQDTLLGLGHSGYLATARRALVYTLRMNRVEASPAEIEQVMAAWRDLVPYPDVLPGLERLKQKFKLVALSNGDAPFLDHLVRNRITFDFDLVFSVDTVGVFKPHPAVYRRAAAEMALEPQQVLMVSSNSFDVMGARTCAMRGAYVDREGLPYEDSPYLPDLTVRDFRELASALL